MVGPNFCREMFQDVAAREGVDQVTLRRGEAGMLRTFIDTVQVEAGRWEPPLADEDWHAICHAIYKGVDGAEWQNLRHKFVDNKKMVNGIIFYCSRSRLEACSPPKCMSSCASENWEQKAEAVMNSDNCKKKKKRQCRSVD